MENIKQRLIEVMADFLDSEDVIMDLAIARKKEPIDRTESELHIRMAKKAFKELKNSIESY